MGITRRVLVSSALGQNEGDKKAKEGRTPRITGGAERVRLVIAERVRDGTHILGLCAECSARKAGATAYSACTSRRQHA
jgi:hypothetical protein